MAGPAYSCMSAVSAPGRLVCSAPLRSSLCSPSLWCLVLCGVSGRDWLLVGCGGGVYNRT